MRKGGKRLAPTDHTPKWVSLLGLYVGILSLLPATALDGGYWVASLLRPLPLLLNLLPGVGLVWLFYCLTGRGWSAYLLGGLPCVLLSLINYYKVLLRGDPLLMTDVRLFSEARGIVGHYTLQLGWVVPLLLVLFPLGLLLSWRAIRPLQLPLRGRLLRSGVCLGLFLLSLPLLYFNKYVYRATQDLKRANLWSETDQYLCRGFLYPLLHSAPDLVPQAPPGYSNAKGQEVLSHYPDRDIPQEQQVDVVGVMLEAFSDLTQFSQLSRYPQVREVYSVYRELKNSCVSGNLLTNIFAGGTVNSEWCFLTGYSSFEPFRSKTDSYVWYFRTQGYSTRYLHPGYHWFYNRSNVNEYLGFQDSRFSEDYFAELVDPYLAVWRSDYFLVDSILESLPWEREAAPTFSFTVSYQNHGPYYHHKEDETYLTPAESGLSQESCDILNSYLSGVIDTAWNMRRLTQELELRERPCVLVLFGDHKPWLGDNESVYEELGVDLEPDSLLGFRNCHSTPYLIWANSAAKQVLKSDFQGKGPDISPCYLMGELFRLCSWEGPGFMQLSREMESVSPLLYTGGLFLQEGELCDALPPQEERFYQKYLWAQYYREHKLQPWETLP